MRNYIVSVLVAFCILLVGISDDTWANNFGGGTCEGPSGCRRLRSEEICHAQCGTLKQGPTALMNPATGECPPNTDPICSWNPLTCQQGATCSSDADCGGGGTCGGTELMPNDLQGLEWNSSHPSWNKLCKWDAMVPNAYTPIYYGGQVGPQAKTREFGVVASCSIADYNDPVWSEPGKKKVDYIDYCRNGVSNAGAIQVPLSSQQGQCGWQQAPKVCQCQLSLCRDGQYLTNGYLAASFNTYIVQNENSSPVGTVYGTTLGKPYYIPKGSIDEAIDAIYAGWPHLRKQSGVAAHVLEQSTYTNQLFLPLSLKITARDSVVLTPSARGGYQMPSPPPVRSSGSSQLMSHSSLQSEDQIIVVSAGGGSVGLATSPGATVSELRARNPEHSFVDIRPHGVYVAGPYKMCVSTTPSSEPVCGSAHGVATATAPSGSALCSVGVPFGIVNGPQGNPASYTWLCQNSVGKKVQCQAPYQPPVLAETCVPYQPSVHGNTAVSLGSAKALGLSAVGTTIPSHPDVSVSTEDYQVLSGDLGSGSYLKVTFTNLFRPILIGPYMPQFIQHTNPANNNKFYGCNPADRNVTNPGAWNTHFKVSCEVCTATPIDQGTWVCEQSTGHSSGQWRSKGSYNAKCTAFIKPKNGGDWQEEQSRATVQNGECELSQPFQHQSQYYNISVGWFPDPDTDPTFDRDAWLNNSHSSTLPRCLSSNCGYACHINPDQHPDKCEYVSNSVSTPPQAVCKDGQGNILPDSACTAPKPDCLPKTYAWETGDWGVCTGGSQTRTVVCKDSTGAVVADNFCPSPKPTTTQSCTNQQGVCGPSHGRPFMTSFVGTNFAHVPGTPVPQITAGLCTSGTPSAITKVTPASGVQYWSWTCGSGQGQATCSSHVACNGVKACDDKTYCAGYIPPSAPRCENPSYDKINECRRQCRKNGPYDLVDSVDHTDEGNGGGYHNGNADFTHPACPPDYCIADANQSNCDRLEGTWNYGFAQNGLCTVCPGGNCYGTFNTAVEVGVQYCRNCDTPGDKGGYTTLFDGEYGGCNNAFSWDACYRSKGYRKNTMISSLRKIGETCLIGTPRGNAPNNGRVSSFGIGVGLVSPNKVCEPANLPGSNWSIREPGAGRYAQTLSIH